MSTPHNIALINLRALTGIELAYLLREQSERNDIGAYAAVKAIAEEIARRQQAQR
jgi:hypothetical protein